MLAVEPLAGPNIKYLVPFIISKEAYCISAIFVLLLAYPKRLLALPNAFLVLAL
jgi:hypothetical protein